MSIEEKAKAYDEAIKKAKYYYDEGKTLEYAIDIVSDIFPELKESEEGKIKKIIKQSLKSFFEGKLSSGTNDVDYAMCLTWLKKQGKNNMGISEATKKKLEDNLNEALEKETPESWNKFLDEQGEQKQILDVEIPFGAKDSELQEAIYYIPKVFHAKIEGDKVVIKKGEQKLYVNDNAKEMFIKALERVEEQNNKGYKLTDCDKNSWWEDFKAYTSCTIEQKPAAWSEEDETTKNNISHIIRQYDKISKRENQPCYYVGDCLLWMQNIKGRVQPQPMQQWSEEDKAMLDFAIKAVGLCKQYAINHQVNGYSNLPDVPRKYEELQDWLKSLKERYTWKPSEEQMDALRYVTNFDYGGHKATLVSLYEQLKKLKDEK